MYQKMLEVRRFEEKAIGLFGENLIRGTLHSCIGQEGVAVGICSALEPSDYITSTHRGHGHCIAKGAELGPMMAELLARDTGYCHGLGGSMHIADLSLGILGANGIVGGGIGIAVGSALTAKLKGTGRVTACFFGDGGANQGTFHEGINLAAVWKLPVVFVCENNQYADTTPFQETTAVPDISSRASSYGIPGLGIDGNDVLAVYEAAAQAVSHARSGQGPVLMECRTYRWEGHYYGDPQVYRTKEEVGEWKKQDPIPRLAKQILKDGVATQKELDEIENQARRGVEAAVEFALQSPPAQISESLSRLYP